jgi:hypothetical protein
MWWCTPVISAHGSLRQEDCEFKACRGYIGTPYLKKIKSGVSQIEGSPEKQFTRSYFEKKKPSGRKGLVQWLMV